MLRCGPQRVKKIPDRLYCRLSSGLRGTMTQTPSQTPLSYLSATGPSISRRVRLLVMGILLTLAGGVIAAFIVIGLVVALSYRQNLSAEYFWMNLAPAVLIYAVAAAGFLIVGVGSIRKRRWSQPVVLGGAWAWLSVG